jgi:hypothetical protein
MKFPKNKAEWLAQLNEQYRQGYANGERNGHQKAEQDFRLRQQDARVRALESITRYASVTGQTMEAFAKAMQSEANQL